VTSSTTRMDTLPHVLTVRQVSLLLGVAENTVYESIRRREIPSVRVGRRLLVSRDALMRWLDGVDEDTRTFGTTRRTPRDEER
jgi:excisionase family DNA binding protein